MAVFSYYTVNAIYVIACFLSSMKQIIGQPSFLHVSNDAKLFDSNEKTFSTFNKKYDK